MDINFGSVVDGTMLAVNHMKETKTGGVVLNVASISAFNPIPNAPVYSATKAAVNQYTRSVGAFLKPDTGIQCHAICPWFVDTPLLKPQVLELIKATGSRLIEPMEVAEAGYDLMNDKEAKNGSCLRIYTKKDKLVKKVYDYPMEFTPSKM
mmetsp:Transcript_20049/g.31370  ORF Transcript_20049/g.31370 Transcript_20049/m.31370 type:complete len:151 (+) Transcript_20049:365-817(+)